MSKKNEEIFAADNIDRWILENVPGALESTRPRPRVEPEMDLETAKLIVALLDEDDTDRPVTFEERKALRIVNEQIEPNIQIGMIWKRGA